MQQKDAKFYFLNNIMITCISINGVPFGSVKLCTRLMFTQNLERSNKDTFLSCWSNIRKNNIFIFII